MLPAIYLATNTYFKKKLTLAASFSITGAGFSTIFMPLVCNKLLKHFGTTKATVLILSAVSLIAIPCAMLLKPIKTRKTDSKNDAEMNKLNENNEDESRNKQDTPPKNVRSSSQIKNFP